MSELYKCPICRVGMRIVSRFGGGHVYMCHNDACEVVGQEIGTTMLEALNRRAPSAERHTLEGDRHPESYCHKCGGPNIVWFVANPLWNKYVPDDGIICPVCFVQIAESCGLECIAWELVHRTQPQIEQPQGEPAAEGLKSIDPALLEPFKKEMQEKTIPAIVDAVHQRQRNAAEDRGVLYTHQQPQDIPTWLYDGLHLIAGTFGKEIAVPRAKAAELLDRLSAREALEQPQAQGESIHKAPEEMRAINRRLREAAGVVEVCSICDIAGCSHIRERNEQGDTVPMPQNADQAQMMANLGIAWLEANAPERLKQPRAAVPDGWGLEITDPDGDGDYLVMRITSPNGASTGFHGAYGSSTWEALKCFQTELAAAPAQPGYADAPNDVRVRTGNFAFSAESRECGIYSDGGELLAKSVLGDKAHAALLSTVDACTLVAPTQPGDILAITAHAEDTSGSGLVMKPGEGE